MRLQGRIAGRDGIWVVTIEGGKVRSVRAAAAASGDGAADPAGEYTAASGDPAARGSAPPLWIAPGFLDIQINGYAGHVLNDDNLSAECVEGAIRALWPTGTALAFPTVTTGSAERLLSASKTLGRVIEHGEPAIRRSIAGLHLEGPYISPEDGPRGAHPLAHVRPPSWDEFCRLQDAAGGHYRLVTLAPEWPGSLEFIENAVSAGIVVSIGHTNAAADDIKNAVAAGASMSTHLGNGAHARIPRHPNYIWEQLANDALWAELIPDGFHLPPSVLKCMIRAKGVQRTVLTTDASGVAGMPPGVYRVQGKEVEVRPGGPVLLSGTEYLAGSALRLCDGLSNAMRWAGLTLDQALSTVTTNPAMLFGLTDRTGVLRPGMDANLTLFTLEDGEIRVQQTIVGGEVVFRSAG